MAKKKQRHLNPINRTVAAILAVIWGCVGIAGVLTAFVQHRWAVGIAALFALGYAVLWVRVVVRARLLNWSEIAVPWRRG